MLDAHPYIRCGEETRVIPRILGMHTKTVASQTEMSRLEEAHISESLLRDALASYLLTIIGTDKHCFWAHRSVVLVW